MNRSNKYLSFTVIFGTAVTLSGCIIAPPNNNNGSYQPANNSYQYPKINLSQLHNIDESEANQRLSAKDFRQVRMNEPGNTKWLNSTTNQCVEVLAYQGRVSSVVERDLQFCNEHSGHNSGYNNNSGYNSAPAPVLGQVPPALVDMVGAKGGQAEGYLMNNGYVNRRTQGLWAYWLEQSTGGCVAIKTDDGRYQSIEYVVPNNCR